MAMMVPRAKLIKGDPCASSRAIGELEPVTEDAVSIQTIVETRRASSGAIGASLDGWAGRSRQGFPVGSIDHSDRSPSVPRNGWVGREGSHAESTECRLCRRGPLRPMDDRQASAAP